MATKSFAQLLSCPRSLPRPSVNIQLERECLAIVVALNKFKSYLINCNFEIQTDHRPLICINSKCFANDRLTRWSLALQSYKYTVTYIKGAQNIISDCMSRITYTDDKPDAGNTVGPDA